MRFRVQGFAAWASYPGDPTPKLLPQCIDYGLLIAGGARGTKLGVGLRFSVVF